jgi:4-hydroxy-3-methylbut-2-enyl diphosphate reductase
MNLWVAQPRGFCAGVDRAISIVDELISLSDSPVYVRHEIVHNRAVVDALAARGAVFVESIDEIPPGSFAVVSAHGAAPAVYAQAKAANLRLFDATCPLVSKVHLEVTRHAREGRSVILIGHRGHVEVVGTVGYYQSSQEGKIVVIETEEEARTVEVPDPRHVAYASQTTLAVDTVERIVGTLRSRFPELRGPHREDICYATQNRQDAVRTLCERCQLVMVIGAPHSSNSMRMVEVARERGVQAHLVQSGAEIDPLWFDSITDAGLTSSASAPEHLVTETIERVKRIVPQVSVHGVGTAEDLVFKLPVALVHMRKQRAAVPASTQRNESSTL